MSYFKTHHISSGYFLGYFWWNLGNFLFYQVKLSMIPLASSWEQKAQITQNSLFRNSTFTWFLQKLTMVLIEMLVFIEHVYSVLFLEM